MFDELLSSLRSGENGYLTDISVHSPDSAEWNQILHSIPFQRRNWLDSPWIVAEFYFYRRLIDIFPYEENLYDLFRQQKMNGLISAFGHFEDISKAWIQNDFTIVDTNICLEFGILTSLWGNKKDLSIWPAQLEQNSGSPNAASVNAPLLSAVVENIMINTSTQILDNHLDHVIQYLTQPHTKSRSIGIILDNAGFELLSDMFMGYTLITLKIVDRVVFYTKKHPTFVSDATTHDCMETIQALTELENYPYCHTMGMKWRELVDIEAFSFCDDYFWCQPTGFHQLPPRIATQLERHVMTFIKVASSSSSSQNFVG